MVDNLILQRGLDWERLIEEFLVEVLFLLMHEDTRHSGLIKARATSSTYHLEQVG